MSYQTPSKLNELIDIAFKDPDINKGLNEAGINEFASRLLFKDVGDEIWQPVTVEISELEKLEEKQNRLRRGHGELNEIPINFDKDKSLTNISFMIGAILTLFPLSPLLGISKLKDAANWLLYDGIDSSFWQFTLGVLFVIFGTFIFYIVVRLVLDIRFENLKRRNNNKSTLWSAKHPEIVQEYSSNAIKIKNLQKLIDQNMIEKSLKDRIRSYVNERLIPSYSQDLGDVQTSGLGEVIDVSRTIDTIAKEKLDFLFKTMPGGSIGIAGSRGAGKSTLIHTYCGNDRIVSEINKREILPVMVSAPVKYDFRDFILHLFATTCNSVLTLEQTDKEDDDNQDKASKNPYNRILFRKIISVLQLFLLFGGVLLILSSLFFYSMHNKYHEIKVDKKTTNSMTKKDNDTLAKSKTAIVIEDNPVKDNLTKEQKTNMQDGFFTYYIKTITANPLLPAKLFTIGLSFIIVSIILLYLRQTILNYSLQKKSPSIPSAPINGKKRERAMRGYPANGDLAKTYLKKIKFQQSYTTGWSGGIKLPIAYEGNIQKAVTTQERAMSNPEIVAALSSFLTTLGTNYQVIIGIDELDKMESEFDAKNFLNEIKSIFGLQRCFFLISVSENAMYNFERRGIPFRDVFDSSFDSIIYVDYFNLDSTVLLLQRRVIGRPMLFFYLTYCLSAGLPRDIIRVFREIVRLSQNRRNIVSVCNQLISEDIRQKFQAMSGVLRKINSNKIKKQKLINILHLIGKEVNLDLAKNIITELVNVYRDLDDQRLKNSELDEENQALMEMSEEVLSYLGYIVTVWELFLTDLNENALKAIQEEGLFEQLARSKQYLSIDFGIAKNLTHEVRQKQKFKPLT